jgi:hypothetical protein
MTGGEGDKEIISNRPEFTHKTELLGIAEPLRMAESG